MEKQNNLPKESKDESQMKEPVVEYRRASKMKYSSPLTEEELRESMNTEEFLDYWSKCIDEIFSK